MGQKFAHAVALLDINQQDKTLPLGNPLFGTDIREIKQLDGYWFGEVIFVN
ncbi:hypothetical protein [Crocosphaera sp.]|uniref:hypothetical protein n=1 Tax=Crocosphaera sp. TaxID=2729996 RepID=UPI003F25D2E7|nr:hypothetical protein [Crocosphaera sp.]